MRIRPEFCCLLAAALACNPSAGPGTGLQSVVPGNDTPLPVAEREAYRDDAARLALRYETQGGDPAAYPADIPTAYATALYSALIHVYTATGVAATDSVTSLYRVHTFGMPVTRELYLEVDTTLAWVRALQGGALPTGNTQVDQLLARFGLTLASFSFDVPVLRARQPLNMAAVAVLFEGIPGVLSAAPNGLFGDGDDVRASAAPNGWRLEYSVGSGDCPAGCLARHAWTFLVTPDGNVTFQGSSGAPLPAM